MRLTKLAAALFAIGFASSSVAAEDDDKKQEKVQKVEVTGSSIKRVNAETASPIQIIDAKQIESMGGTNPDASVG